jgi:hypothetical protein
MFRRDSFRDVDDAAELRSRHHFSCLTISMILPLIDVLACTFSPSPVNCTFKFLVVDGLIIEQQINEAQT